MTLKEAYDEIERWVEYNTTREMHRHVFLLSVVKHDRYVAIYRAGYCLIKFNHRSNLKAIKEKIADWCFNLDLAAHEHGKLLFYQEMLKHGYEEYMIAYKELDKQHNETLKTLP